MAKYKVVEHQHEVRDNGKGYKNLFLSLTLQNSSGNSSSRDYRISPDTRWPDLPTLTDTIVAGLDLAKESGAKIELSDYEERKYLFLELPNTDGKVNLQVTAEKIKA